MDKSDTCRFKRISWESPFIARSNGRQKRSGSVSIRGISLNRTMVPLSRLIGLPTTVCIEQGSGPGDRSPERERQRSSKEVVQRY